MADGIHLGEAEFLEDIRYLSDSASEMEGCPVETKVITAHPHATPGEASLGPSIKLSALPWRQGDLTQFEQRTLRSLERIETQHSGAAETILNYRWVADSITEEEMQALASLATMIGRSGGFESQIPQALAVAWWLADGIDTKEMQVLNEVASYWDGGTFWANMLAENLVPATYELRIHPTPTSAPTSTASAFSWGRDGLTSLEEEVLNYLQTIEG